MDSRVLSALKPAPLASCLAGLILARLIWIVIYRLYLHPLARYPGPLLGKLTGAYMVFVMMSGRATTSRYAWHQKYGPVVRTGPNDLCFADADSIKDIYGQSSNPCPKDAPFYSGISLNIADSLFTAIDRFDHARMRRLLAHQFSSVGVRMCVDEIAERVKMYCDKIESSPQPVDIFGLTHNLYLDIISQLSFAKSFDLLKGQSNEAADDIHTYFSIAPLFGMFPFARSLPFGIFKAAKRARPRIVQFVQSCIDDFRTRVKTEHSTTGGLLRQMMEAQDTEASEASGDAAFSDAELIENAILFINAGSETTATTLLYAVYEVGIRPEIYKQLVDEIRTAFPDKDVFPDMDTAAGLPYLNSVIQETLRLRGPASAAAPRISPGKVIAGTFVLKGTGVSSQPYSTQRDPNVFPKPLEFSPERWLDNVSSDMKLMYRPFLSGPRSCIGMHLANAQLLLTLCALYQRFDVRVDRNRTTDEMMKLSDMGLLSPMGKQLWVSVKPR